MKHRRAGSVDEALLHQRLIYFLSETQSSLWVGTVAVEALFVKRPFDMLGESLVLKGTFDVVHLGWALRAGVVEKSFQSMVDSEVRLTRT